MCTSPIIIKNKRKHFINGVDKEYLKVPCGHCLECRNKKRNELYVLSYFEYLNAKYRGGFTQFFTLTYDEEHLPRFAGRPCFNGDDITDYFKRVTTECKRIFGNDFKFRRLVTCEYGHLNKRPHYHFLVFVQSPCNHYKFRQILKSKWPFGFSFGSWDNFGEVNRPNGIRYVTKYVCKDSFDDSEEKDWINSFNDVEHGVPFSLYYRARRHTAFCRHSHKFGFCALDHILNDVSFIPEHFRTSWDILLKRGEILVPCGENGVPTYVPLPRTLYRKLFYFVTWRYKRITKRDILLHEQHGTPIPKHKVQSFYIPNIHYKERFKYELFNYVDKTNDNITLYLGCPNRNLSFYSWFRPDYCPNSVTSRLDMSYVLDKLCKIKMERDPIFSRDPFDKNIFYYERAPIEKDSFPDIQRFMQSLYNTDSSALLRSLDAALDSDNVIKSSKNFSLEKTYKDNKAFCA